MNALVVLDPCLNFDQLVRDVFGFKRRQRAGEIDVGKVEDVVVLQRKIDAELEERVDHGDSRHALLGAMKGGLKDGPVEVGDTFAIGEPRFLPCCTQPVNTLR